MRAADDDGETRNERGARVRAPPPHVVLTPTERGTSGRAHPDDEDDGAGEQAERRVRSVGRSMHST